MAKKPAKLSDQIRHLIETSDKTRYRIAQETGISEATLSRFVTGRGNLSMRALDLVGQSLGLKIVRDEADSKAKRGTK